MPLLQNKNFDLTQEEDFVRDLLTTIEGKVSFKGIYFTTAYFNPPYTFFDPLISQKTDHFTFVTSAKEVIKCYVRPIAFLVQIFPKVKFHTFTKEH